MGREAADDHRQESNTRPKLTLQISRPSKPMGPPEMPTPPPQTAVSVPFQWEEAPGKPRPCHTQSKPKSLARTLELPPRLVFSEPKVSNMPSPTTVLDGPYVGRTVSFTTSYRSTLGLSKEHWNGNFGSSRWNGLRKSREDFEGSFDFLGCTTGARRYGVTSKVKIARLKRGGSFFSLSQTRSHLWVSESPTAPNFIVK